LTTVEVLHAAGIEGAREAAGVVVVIDVLRAFTVSAYALAGGARECLLVSTVAEARALADSTPGAVLSAEVDGLPVLGIDISNSPTQVTRADVRGRVVVQRTSAGTPSINAVSGGLAIYAGSLVVARATAQACLSRHPAKVTLVASADVPEDHACARYLEALLHGATLPVDELLAPFFESERYRRFARGDWPGFPATDLELALTADRFDFAMIATRRDGVVCLTRETVIGAPGLTR
jgi:2-phosphosulfolactate phosphatase